MLRIAGFFRRTPAPPTRPLETQISLEDLLKRDADRVHRIDPQTENQWRSLNTAIQRTTSTEPVRYASVRPQFVRRAAVLAAATVVLIVISALWTRHPSTQLYETHKGETSSILLPDSSEVMLNHTSELTVTHTSPQNSREVALNGEAYFRVKANGAPFVVTTSIAIVRVLGTEFNVRVREDQLEVAVLRGRVEVASVIPGKENSIILAAGEISTCLRDSSPEPPAPLLFSEYPGWMHGKLLFYRTHLTTACQEIESKFDVVIRIATPGLQEKTITGAVDARNAETAISILSRLTGSSYRHEKGAYTLY